MKPGKLADYLAFTLYTGHGWRKTKAQKPADFSLDRKQRSILFSVIWVQNKVLTDYFISQFQLMESLFFIKTYHIYHEKSDQKYDGVDPSLHSNHLDYEVERRFGWGWQDWRTLLGKPSTFWTFNFTIFGNLAHRWMWAKPHLGTKQTLGFLKDAREREREKKNQSLSQQEQKNDKSSTDLRLVQTTVTSRK